MIAVLVLLWLSTLTAVAAVVCLIREHTTPPCGDLIDLQRYRDARTALDRLNSRHSVATSASTRRDYGTRFAGMSPHGAEVAPIARAARGGHALFPPGRGVPATIARPAAPPRAAGRVVSRDTAHRSAR